jgi:hydrogenase nickel incorporation protein HypB
LAGIDILFIENVGNLVCPASFDIGQHCNVVLLSVTEGDDKPSKYPIMFRAGSQVLITKTDLLPYIEEFSVVRARAAIRAIRGDMPVIELSSKNGQGMDQWIAWLLQSVAERKVEA